MVSQPAPPPPLCDICKVRPAVYIDICRTCGRKTGVEIDEWGNRR